MTVDAARVSERLAFIAANIAKLRELSSFQRDAFFADFRNVEASEHLLQTSIQAMIDIASHLAARSDRPRPETYEGTLARLVEDGVLDRPRLERWKAMGRLRNLLVHGYARVAATEIRRILEEDLGDLEAFVGEVSVWLQARPER